MKPVFAILLCALFALAGCAGPRQFKAPDAGKLIAAQKALQETVALAHVKVQSGAGHVEAAAGHLVSATVSHSKESVLLGEIGPRLLALRAGITDAVLREQADALSAEVAQTRELAILTDTELAATGKEHGFARDDLGLANVTLLTATGQAEEINAKYGPEYVAAVGKTVSKANAAVAKLEDDLRSWLIFGRTVLAIVFGAAFLLAWRLTHGITKTAPTIWSWVLRVAICLAAGAAASGGIFYIVTTVL